MSIYLKGIMPMSDIFMERYKQFVAKQCMQKLVFEEDSKFEGIV